MAQSEKPKLRVLLHPKDHPWRCDSGYSIPAQYLVNGLHRDLDLAVFAPVGGKYKVEYYFPDLGLIGYDPAFSLTEDDKEIIFADHVVPIYPGISEDYGEQIVEEHYQHFQAELLWQIADAWPLTRIPDLAKGDRVRWVIQCPIDYMEVPPYVADRLSAAIRVVPWVEDARERLVKAGLKNVAEPIPLGINTDIWTPQDRVNKPTTMRDLGFSYDTFNIVMVAANQYGRKAWEQSLRAIKIFREKRPEVPVRLYLHTHDQIGDGWDMNQLLNYAGVADITRTAKPYHLTMGLYTEYQIMLMHALADVVINCGLEGFGYSTIQAQAVGTPVIGLNAGATVNLVESGILVPPYSDLVTRNLLRRVEPHPTHIAQALERIYETPRTEFKRGIEFVRQNFAWPLVIEKWKKLFSEVDAEFERKCIKSRRYPPAPSERAIEASKEMVILE